MLELETPHDTAARLDAYRDVAELAEWSAWAPLTDVLVRAPRLPGVYLLREHDTHHVRYVGVAGERGGGGRPPGLYGRLSVHLSGKGPVSGFSEAALDRALADPAWVARRLEDLTAVAPRRVRDWAREAVLRLAPEVTWATFEEAADARHLEARAEGLLRPYALWR